MPFLSFNLFQKGLDIAGLCLHSVYDGMTHGAVLISRVMLYLVTESRLCGLNWCRCGVGSKPGSLILWNCLVLTTIEKGRLMSEGVLVS